MLPNVSVAPNRNKLKHYVLLAATGWTHLLALYWLMVFIHETHVMPSSGKVKTKRQLFSYLVLAGRVLPKGSVAPNRNKLPHYVHVSGTCCTHLLALFWLMVFIHETHVMPSSGKIKTKRHLFSYFVSGPRVFQPLLVDPTQVESKKSSQIQWPVPSINAEPVDISLGEE